MSPAAYEQARTYLEVGEDNLVLLTVDDRHFDHTPLLLQAAKQHFVLMVHYEYVDQRSAVYVRIRCHLEGKLKQLVKHAVDELLRQFVAKEKLLQTSISVMAYRLLATRQLNREVLLGVKIVVSLQEVCPEVRRVLGEVLGCYQAFGVHLGLRLLVLICLLFGFGRNVVCRQLVDDHLIHLRQVLRRLLRAYCCCQEH